MSTPDDIELDEDGDTAHASSSSAPAAPKPEGESSRPAWWSKFGQKAAQLKEASKTALEATKNSIANEVKLVARDMQDLKDGVKEGVKLTVQDTHELRERLGKDDRVKKVQDQVQGLFAPPKRETEASSSTAAPEPAAVSVEDAGTQDQGGSKPGSSRGGAGGVAGKFAEILEKSDKEVLEDLKKGGAKAAERVKDVSGKLWQKTDSLFQGFRRGSSSSEVPPSACVPEVGSIVEGRSGQGDATVISVSPDGVGVRWHSDQSEAVVSPEDILVKKNHERAQKGAVEKQVEAAGGAVIEASANEEAAGLDLLDLSPAAPALAAETADFLESPAAAPASAAAANGDTGAKSLESAPTSVAVGNTDSEATGLAVAPVSAAAASANGDTAAKSSAAAAPAHAAAANGDTGAQSPTAVSPANTAAANSGTGAKSPASTAPKSAAAANSDTRAKSPASTAPTNAAAANGSANSAAALEDDAWLDDVFNDTVPATTSGAERPAASVVTGTGGASTATIDADFDALWDEMMDDK